MKRDAQHLFGLVLLCAVMVIGPRAQTPPPSAAPVLTWAKPDHFWYRTTVAGSNVWLNVNGLYGVKEPLFDHQRLAIELSLRTGNEYTPTTLPFADPAMEFVVKYDGSNAYIQEGAMAIEFVLDSTQWRCDLQIKWDWNRVPPTDYECLPRRPAAPRAATAPSTPAPVRSPDGRYEAFVQNFNVAIRATAGAPGSPTALSTDGVARDAYQHGSIQWSRDGKTLTAYRVHEDVWKSDSVTGSVKTLVKKGEWTVQAR